MTEAEEIAAYLAAHGVTRCPTKYLLPTLTCDDAPMPAIPIRKKGKYYGGGQHCRSARKMRATWAYQLNR